MERITSLVAATRTYLREVLGELSKVSWPSRERTAKLTGVVVVMVLLIAGFLYLVDYPLNVGMLALFGQ